MNLKGTLKRLLVCYTMAHLTGCATLFIPKNQKVTIKTQRHNSTVFVNNEEAGKGETIVTRLKKDGAKQVVVQTPGYKDAYYVLVQKKRHAAYWPMVALDLPTAPLVYPLLIDAVPMPKFFCFAKVNELSSTYKYSNRANNEKFIDLEAIKLKVDNKDKDLRDYYGVVFSSDIMGEMEKAENNQLKYEQKREAKDLKKKKKKTLLEEDNNKLNYDDTKFSETLYKTLKKTGYVDTVNKIFHDNNNTIALEGVIKKASVFHIQGSGGSSYRKAKVNITWNIKNSFGEKLDSVNAWSYSGDFIYNSGDKGEKMFADAVENSYLSLLKNSRFTKHLPVDTSFGTTDPLLSVNIPKKSVQDVSEATTATVTIKREDGGHGSGFAITNDGYILTNFHVITGNTINKLANLTVILSDGEQVPVTVVRYNRMRDIALLKVNKTFEKAFNLNGTKSFRNLMEVYTIGTPKSIELGQSVSLGIISNERKYNNNSLLQLSMSVNSGNSGGPLFEKNGTLQGVVTGKLVGYATEGVGFAIPSYLIPAYLNLSFN
ncbi:MAG: trypsin-like peptidase domain-containing protein [Flavisolibacter sp.]|nr:trypsin-like peptidase domain-containing protein [Flavisolibacter sp.]